MYTILFFKIYILRKKYCILKGIFVGVWCMLDSFDEYVCRCTGNPLLTVNERLE